MTDTTNKFHRHADRMRSAANVIDDLHRFLGPLADRINLFTSTYRDRFEVRLMADTEDRLAGSVWHRTVLRLSDYFDEPVIVDDLDKVQATFETPFDVDVVVWTQKRGFQPAPAQITLAEAVA